MRQDPAKRTRFPWWVWLFIILFPISFGIAHWWVALASLGIFAVLLWAITDYYGE